MNFGIILAIIILLAIDFYVYYAMRILLRKRKTTFRKALKITYWILPVIPLIGMIVYPNIEGFEAARNVRYVIFAFFSINYIPKIFVTIILIAHDAIGFFNWLIRITTLKKERKKLAGSPISRGEFLAKVSLVTAVAPMALMGYGIIKGAHDYRVRRVRLPLKNLPKEFDGITIAQLSDIHSGSFFNKTAVRGGVDILLAEKPDVVFFTGDLVNDATSEVNDYIQVFQKIKAPLGVYSTTGNHDYGDYSSWPTKAAKDQNFKDLITAHKELGFDLMLNESRVLEVGGERISILGVENWGGGRFQKYGDLKKTYESAEDAPVKLLLSHDPSHWDAQVRPNYKDIDVTFSGHTHGFQFGVEIGNYRWSPSQYIYKQWADLYQEGDQFIYVNRGFGFIGYPGRIGIAPEITIFELVRPS